MKNKNSSTLRIPTGSARELVDLSKRRREARVEAMSQNASTPRNRPESLQEFIDLCAEMRVKQVIATTFTPYPKVPEGTSESNNYNTAATFAAIQILERQSASEGRGR